MAVLKGAALKVAASGSELTVLKVVAALKREFSQRASNASDWWEAKFNPLGELVGGKIVSNNPGKAGSPLLVSQYYDLREAKGKIFPKKGGVP